jgi:hypothetical protein
VTTAPGLLDEHVEPRNRRSSAHGKLGGAEPDRALEKLPVRVDERNQGHGHAQQSATSLVSLSKPSSVGESSKQVAFSARKRSGSRIGSADVGSIEFLSSSVTITR